MFRIPRNQYPRVAPLVFLVFAAAALPALAEFRLERELALAPGGTFVLDTDGGAIDIRGVDRAGARVVVTSPRDDVEERFTFSFEERGDGATVRVDRRGSWTSRRLSGGGDRLHFEIWVPRGVDVDLSTAGGAIDAASIQGRADLHSSGGGIQITDVEGTVDAYTSGGAVTATDIRGEARLRTSGGSIRAQRVDGDLTAETSGGSIDLREAGGAVQAHTSGGPVRASLAPGNASGGNLSTSGGGITASVDPAVSLDVDLRASGGRVSLELPITVSGSVSRNTVRGALNGGGPLLKLHSNGGSVRLKAL